MIFVPWIHFLAVHLMPLALSCQEAVDDSLLDASCLLEVLRMYRWQISSFEEQVVAKGTWPAVGGLSGQVRRAPFQCSFATEGPLNRVTKGQTWVCVYGT